MNLRHALSMLAAAASLAGCANLAPRYEQPAAPVAAHWPSAASASATGATPATPAAAALPYSADLGWRDVVHDDRLRGTIDLALNGNRSLRQTLLAIEQSRAAYGIGAAEAWPTLKASATGSATHTPAQASTSGVSSTSRSLSVGLGISAYELDFFGRVANLKDAALESFLATEASARSARVALVAEVAAAWLTLDAGQRQLAFARETLASQRRSVELTQQRRALGADSGLTLAQAQSAMEAARRDVAAAEAQVQQDGHALDLLVGSPLPEALRPAMTTTSTGSALVGVPEGLPSSLLQQRPDVQAAEHSLKAAHADIGAARAALYPSISLTGAAGTASRSLTDLFQGGAWSFAPSISLPILDGGAGRAAVRSAEVARDIRVAAYEQALQSAFREVADALAVRASLAERLDAQAALVEAASRSQTLAEARWRGGASSYLEVLDAQRTAQAAQQAQITLQLADQVNRLTLFKVLGGGWSGSRPDADAPPQGVAAASRALAPWCRRPPSVRPASRIALHLCFQVGWLGFAGASGICS